MNDVVFWVLVGVAVIGFSYACARAVSYAHHKTKLEFFRALARDIGETSDGEKRE